MLGRVAMGLAVLLAMFAFGGTIQKGITNLRTESITKVASVTTTSGTTGNITLTRELFGDNLANITSVVSSEPTDVPLASGYVYATETLTIDGLATGTTRNITVIYRSELNDTFWSAVGPFLPFLIFGGILAAIVYSIWKPSRR